MSSIPASPEGVPEVLDNYAEASSVINKVVSLARKGRQPQDLIEMFGPVIYDMAKARIRYSKDYSQPVFMDSEGGRYACSETVASFRSDRVSGHSVADVSCGVGIQAIMFSMKASSVVCLDIDPMKTALASLNARSYGISNISFHTADALSHEALSLTEGCDIIYSDPARPPSEKTRELYNLQPPLDRVIKHYNKPYILDLPPQIERHKITGLGELEYISLNGSINRLTAYSPEIACRERSAVTLPAGARLEYDPELPRNVRMGKVQAFLYEVDQSIFYSDLLPELISDTGLDICVNSKKRTIASSEGPVSHPFLVKGYEVIGRSYTIDGMNRVLREAGCGSATLRFHIDPSEYWALRNRVESGLVGDLKAAIFRINGEYIACLPA